MFKKVVILLNNGEKITSKKIKIKDLDIEFETKLKFYGYFSDPKTALKEGYFKNWFKKSRVFTFDSNIIPEYEINNLVLTVKTKLEEF